MNDTNLLLIICTGSTIAVAGMLCIVHLRVKTLRRDFHQEMTDVWSSIRHLQQHAYLKEPPASRKK